MNETGFLNRAVTVAGLEYRCQIYVPLGYTMDRSWPVILFLHGVGEGGHDGLLPTEVGIGSAIRRHAERFPAIVVFPQARAGCRGWRGDAAVAALRALDRAVAEFRGEPQRLYLTGLSMGGSGALRIAARNPGRFAAVVPVSADFEGELDPAQPAGTGGADPYLVLARAIGKTPVWVFQGGKDTTPPPAATRRLVSALRQHSTDVRYTEYANAGHNAWDQAYAEPMLMPWLLAQRRGFSPIVPLPSHRAELPYR